ncbi:hypothetical protein J4H86_12105 [Spiractinospora alimapuensis]|uniref:hypothetical protein n=1 Tax=Spiractinospora alimapuensis TaxID=2820884 RepID=UPI001F40BA7C|nr:hypothetical protein [Spiractinospora alimapuensis]QVQ54351.1 hypothetical protein J4H86_12105 [Spiractinospora alimapuensis]
MRRSARLAPLAPALALVASCSTTSPDEDAPAETTDVEEQESTEVEDTWEPRESDAHGSAEPRLVVADEAGGQVHVIAVSTGEPLDSFDVTGPLDLTSVDADGSQVLVGDDTVLDTGIRWEPHGGHLDPDNGDPALVADEDEVTEARETSEDDPFDATAIESVDGPTVTVHPPEGTELSVELPDEVAAATWDPYWEQALALTVDGTLHTIDPESGEISGSERVTGAVDGEEGGATIAAAENHVYVSDAATRTIVEVDVSRDGLETDRVRVLDFAPSDLLAVGMEPLAHEHHDEEHDDHDHEHDDEEHDH